MLRASAGFTGTEDDDEGRGRLADVFGGDADAAQVTELLAPLAGLGGTSAAIEEIQWAVRRYLEALAGSVPVIWVVDDIQWAEPAFLSVVEDLVDWTAMRLWSCCAWPARSSSMTTPPGVGGS